ncbi:glycosyltransferase like family 2-domain-containing protein [Aspergillus falconensis]
MRFDTPLCRFDEDQNMEPILVPRRLPTIPEATERMYERAPWPAVHPIFKLQPPPMPTDNCEPSPTVASPQGPERSLKLHWRDAIRQQGGREELPGQVPRSTSHTSFYNMARLVNIKHQRGFWGKFLIEYGVYTLFAAFVYLVLIGVPLWKGAVYWLYWLMQHKFVFQGGWAIVIAVLIFYTYIPLLAIFEDDAPGPEYYEQRNIEPRALNTALLIPTYRSAPILGRTLTAALKVFPAQNIYVVANGNSSTPLDNTEEICRHYSVNHIWSPVGSKIVALFVGCYAVKPFRSVLVMDDDCILPPNFIVVASRLSDTTRCIGYTIKAAGISRKESTWCQKAQDLEYKLAGLQRCFAARVGSATFPHGAISLWDRAFLQKTLEHHPGFSISEDWFLGDSCRQMGGRIQMCSAVFVETGTPSSLMIGERNQERGGFGEMTVCRQRFTRWNFFNTTGVWHNIAYIFGSWKLGAWEVGTKIFVLQEVYETVLYLLTPFVLPVSLIVQPWFCISMSVAILGLYLLHVIFFNEIHLRRKKERVSMATVVGFYASSPFCVPLSKNQY